MAVSSAYQHELDRGALSLPKLAVQGLAVIGPSITAAVLITGIAGVALSATPLVFAVATIAILINASTAVQYSKKITSSGGFFSYVSHGFGSKTGIMAGLYQLFYQINNVSFLALWNGYFIGEVYGFFTGTPVSIYAMLGIALLTVVFYYGVQYIGIRRAVNFNFITGLIEAAFLVIVSLIIIALSGPANTDSVFTPGVAGWNGVGLGMILALLSYGGYTTVVSLAEEAKKPKESVGKAIIITVVAAGLIFVVTSYAFTIGFGVGNMATFAGLPLPGFTVVKSYVGLVAAAILAFIVLSANLNAVNGQMVNVSRLVYRMSRDGFLPHSLGKVHHKYKSPHYALTALTIVSTIVMIITFFTVKPLINGVFLLATFATVGTIMVHTISNMSLINFYRGKGFKIVLHGVLPIVGSVLILYALYASIWPPVFPFYLAPIALVIWSVLSVVYIYVFANRNKDKVEEIGKFTL